MPWQTNANRSGDSSNRSELWASTLVRCGLYRLDQRRRRAIDSGEGNVLPECVETRRAALSRIRWARRSLGFHAAYSGGSVAPNETASLNPGPRPEQHKADGILRTLAPRPLFKMADDRVLL